MSDSTSSVSSTSTTGNVLRITGLATGLDVDATVKKLMAAEQTKIDKAKQAQQTIQWQQDAYKDIISDVQSLQSSFFNVTSSDTNMLSPTNYAAYDVTTSDATVGTVTAGVSAQTGSYTLKVVNAASSANYSNTLTSNDLSTVSLSSKLTTLGTDATTNSGALTLALSVTSGTTTTPISITLDNSGGAKTVNDLVTAINDQGKGLVTASFSELTKQFTIKTTTSGSGTTLSMDTTTTSAGLQSMVGTSTVGKNADVFITEPGGTAVEVTSQSSNAFSYDGVNYSISGVGTTTISVTQDAQKVYDKFNTFLTKYNALVDKIQTALTDKKDSDYPALTDAQKSSMTTDQITSWNAKAKVGVLHNDTKLTQLLSDLKSAFSSPVSGVSLQLGKYNSNSIGLDTSDDYTTPAEVHIIDQNEFKNAISQNTSALYKLFTNVSTSTDTDTQNSENGIFTRIQKILQSNVGVVGTTSNSATLTQYANYQDSYSKFGSVGLNTLLDQIYQKNNLITTLNTEYSTMQTSFYNKFSALETAMNTLNSQSSTLTSMLG